ncbi:MAG: alpha/beta fold hydrolase [Planctomycetota bacterium]
MSGLLASEPEQVAFHTPDGFWVHADYYGPTTKYVSGPIVILLHAEGADREVWKPLIDPLQEAGFVVLALDMRGHGASSTSETRTQLANRDPRLFQDVQHDLHGAYDWLAKQEYVDRARFALVGAGAGAGSALQYAAKDRSVDTVVCLSPEQQAPGLDPAGDLGQIHGRQILLIASEDEQEACKLLTKRSQDTQTYFYEGAEGQRGGTDILGKLPGIEKRIVSFLSRSVGQPSRSVVYGSINSNIYHTAGSRWIDEISRGNLRHYSSAREAEQRGLRASRSKGPRGKKIQEKTERRQPPANP